jgi:hypothetical protein
MLAPILLIVGLIGFWLVRVRTIRRQPQRVRAPLGALGEPAA